MYCRGCGYALIGLPSNRCPECGRDFDPDNSRTFVVRPRRVVLRKIVIIVLVFSCLTALVFASYFGYLAWQVHQEAKAIQMLEVNGWKVDTYDTRPPWAKFIFRRHGTWLWRRALSVWVNPQNNVAQSMAAVADLKSLGNLYLHRAPVSDKDLAKIKDLTTLSVLYLGDQITDAGLAQLKRLPALHALDLTCPHVTDEGLAQLKSLASLQLLILCNTCVTGAGVADFKKGLPSCKVVVRSTIRPTSDPAN
jgi:hypothetical protein